MASQKGKKSTPKKAPAKTAAAPKKRSGSPRVPTEKKEYAKLLFIKEGCDRKTAAQRAGVNEKTVGEWVRTEGWEAQRKSLLVTKEEELKNLLEQLAELNASIKKKPVGQRYANPAEADTQGKITSSIRKLVTDAGLTEVMEVITTLVTFCQKNFPEKMQVLIPIYDAFVKQYL